MVRRLLVTCLVGVVLAVPAGADDADAWRQLGRLRAGSARRAREEERSSVRAGLLYLQAAQAFARAGDDEARKALVAGINAGRPLRASWLHREGVAAMAFLPGGRAVVTIDRAGVARAFDVANGQETRSFRTDLDRDGREVRAAFSADGARLLVWAAFGLQLWDVREGKRLRAWKLEFQPTAVHFLLGGKRAFAWGGSFDNWLWDLERDREAGKIEESLVLYGDPISRDGTRLLTHERGVVYVWDAADGKLLSKLGERREDRIPAAATFTPDGKQVLVSNLDPGKFHLYDAGTGRVVRTFVCDNESDSRGRMVFSPDGTRLVSSGSIERTILWDVATGKAVHTLKADGSYPALFTRDSSKVLTPGRASLLWDTKTGTLLGRFGQGIWAAFTRDDEAVLLWGGEPRAELWDVGGAERRRVLESPDRVYEVRFNTDQSLLLIWSMPNQGTEAVVRLWDLRQDDGAGKDFRDPPLPRSLVYRHEHAVLSAVQTRDETRLLTADAGGKAHLWDVAAAKRLHSFAHAGLRGAALSPDDAQVLTWGEGGAVLWEARTAKEVRALKHAADVRGALFGPDGKHALTRDADYTVRWWDLSKGEAAGTFEHQRDVLGQALDAKAEQALTWGLDGLRMWDLRAGKAAQEPPQDGPVLGAVFGPEDGRAWAWGPTGLRQWELKTGKELRRLKPAGGVAAAIPARDGRRFLMRTSAGLIKHWDAVAEKELATLTHVFNVYGFQESVAGMTFNGDQTRVLTWSGDGTVHLWDLASALKLKTVRHDKAGGARLTRDEKRLLTWGADGVARLWDADAPQPLAAEDQLLELEVRSGLRIDDQGKTVGLTFADWQARRKKLDEARKKYPR